MNYRARRGKLGASMAAAGFGATLIQNPDNVGYLTGYKAVVGSRPIALLLCGDKNILTVPAVEADYARTEARDIDIAVYYEQPDRQPHERSYYAKLTGMLSGLAPGSRIGVEAASLSLADFDFIGRLGLKPEDMGETLRLMRAVKEPEELEAIRLACRYVGFAVAESFAVIRPGVTEIEIDQNGIFAFIRKAATEKPNASVNYFVMTQSGAERTIMPHAYSGLRRLTAGDGIIHCRQVSIDGYRGQCDRTAFVGRPSQEQAKYYQLVLDARQAALETIRPGIPAARIDAAIRKVYEKEGVAQYYVHRSGHGVGLSLKEAPYLSFDSADVIQESMVFAVQPALYIPDVGGFRCTDTIIVGSDGIEIATDYPRDIASLSF